MSEKRTRAKAALALTFAGDALSMPVHWFYRRSDIVKYFPPSGISGFEAAPDVHPSSIMALHSTRRGGRGSQRVGDAVVGNLILKSKGRYWNQRNMHYHHGMPAGENTLNAWCARWMISWISEQDLNRLSVERWLDHYVERMTSDPPSHPDTYAESYHREFFSNVMDGKPLLKCGGHTHDTPSMGALVTVGPLALALLSTKSLADAQEICRAFVYATHPDRLLMNVVNAYVSLIDRFLNNPAENIEKLLTAAAQTVANGDIKNVVSTADTDDKSISALVAEDSRVIGNRYSTACYITDSWPGVCYLAAKYYRDPATGLLVNTNLGGENAHRGSVLGFMMGLISGESTSHYASLHRHAEIDTEIEGWCNRFFGND